MLIGKWAVGNTWEETSCKAMEPAVEKKYEELGYFVQKQNKYRSSA